MRTLILLFTLSSFAQTYTIDCTTYYADSCYVSGYNVVKRSAANKKAFLCSLGFDKCPAGYEIDHIIPLSLGGSDCPENMQLLAVEEHRRKTAKEAKARKKKL